jgi:hypothetical protein
MNNTDKAIINANTGLNYNGYTYTGGIHVQMGGSNGAFGVTSLETINSSRQLVDQTIRQAYVAEMTMSPSGPVPTSFEYEDYPVTAAIRPIVNLGVGPAVSSGSGTSSSPYVIGGAGGTSYTITYNANGGSGAPAAQTINVGSNATISTTVPTRSSYVFLRWNTAANGSGTSYSPGDAYTAGTSVTLYAQWGQGNYTITLASNFPLVAPALSANPTSGATGAYITIYTEPSGSFSTTVPTVGGGVATIRWTFIGWGSSNSTWTITNATSNSTTVRVGSGDATLTANYNIGS